MQKVNKTLTFGLEKRIKERKNTYEGSPNANLDQNGSGMKQRFQLRAFDQIFVGFHQKGGYYRKSKAVRIVSWISCHDPSRTLVTKLWWLNVTLGSWFGERALPFGLFERPSCARKTKFCYWRGHAARIRICTNSGGPPGPVWSAHTFRNGSFGPCCVFKPFPTLLRLVKPTLRP